MRVFLSWSGERSREAAVTLHDWLQLVMPTSFAPWMSARDIETGSPWATELAQRLEEMDAGISVLMPENLDSPWLNFEARAIGKAFAEFRVMTFLIGLRPTDVPQPLAQFQSTTRSFEDVLSMMATLNAATPTPVRDPEVLRRLVERW